MEAQSPTDSPVPDWLFDDTIPSEARKYALQIHTFELKKKTVAINRRLLIVLAFVCIIIFYLLSFKTFSDLRINEHLLGYFFLLVSILISWSMSKASNSVSHRHKIANKEAEEQLSELGYQLQGGHLRARTSND